jgi:hypothetical protein
VADDGCLEKIDAMARRAAGEVWGNEAGRDGFILGLMAARSVLAPSPAEDTMAGTPYKQALAAVLGPDFKAPEHTPGCRGHKHGRAGCLERGCACPLGIRRLPRA